MNVCHLQAHASFLLSHMSEHALSQFGLVGSRVYVSHMGFTLVPFSQLKHDPNT
jgi:hypothetical protein